MNLTGWYEVITVNELSSFDVAWSAYALVLLALCMLACVEPPKAGEADAPEVRRGSALGTVVAIARRLFG